MTASPIQLLVDAINDPASMQALSLAQWDLLIRQARNADVLSKLGIASQNRGLLELFPAQPRRHLASAALIAKRQLREVHSETRLITSAMARAGCDFVLLKGAAYAMAGLQAGQGRMMSDIDVLVPREALATVESALMFHGWVSSVKSAYDQRYYRKWMHEIPPMRHIHRATTIDVHHAILPLTSRAHPSSARLLADSHPVSDGSRMRVLSPHDMLLHSATHLFHEGELDLGFRGLSDIDNLLRELGERPDF